MFKTLDDMNVEGQRIIVRGDMNVPMVDGKVSDTTRLSRLSPTLMELSDAGAKVIVISHFARPKGQVVPEMSLRPVATALSTVLGKDVTFADDCIGNVAKEAVDAMNNGDILVLENLRFHAGEEKNDADFAKQLAELADAYVNDGFSVSHRAHASTHGIATLLPAYAGRNMQAELNALNSALGNPEKPVAAIVGGAKVSTKLDVLTHLVEKVDVLIIGGGMANTFLYAMGHSVGQSLCESEMADTVKSILAKAGESGCQIVLPNDVAVAGEFKAGADHQIVSSTAIPDDQMALDIGDESITAICDVLSKCKTLVWNGPFGAFEIEPFDKGTMTIAKKVAELTKAGTLVSIGGGGDTVSALHTAGVADDMTYISTAGGAFLEWMEGKELPGVTVLSK